METISAQLQDLSEQAKKTEDVVAACRDRDLTALAAHRERLRESFDNAATKAKQEVDSDDAALQFRWSQVRERVRGQFEELQDRSEQRHADHDAHKAERRAERAERDAADAVDFAALAVDGAMAAIVDAVLARADADDSTSRSAR